jgi:hypothetical protein
MDPLRSEYLKQQYAFDAWRDRNSLGEHLFVWKLFLSGSEIPGWQALRVQPRQQEDGPSIIKSTWQRAEGGTDAAFNIDIFECASRAAAYEALIDVLGEFQSSLITRQEQSSVGDVAFTVPEGYSLLFARANLVVLVRNAGRRLVPVTDLARQFDQDLIARPVTEGVKVVPEIKRFEAPLGAAQVGRSVRLEVEAEDPLERPLWFKFFSRPGEVRLEEGHPASEPAGTGAQEVTVYAINANGGAASQRLEFVTDGSEGR